MHDEIVKFLSGMVAMGELICAAFFLRSWRRSKDGLFLAFAAAFVLLAASQVLTSVFGLPMEEDSWVYLLRFAAFALIILTVLGKNFGAAK